MFDERPSSFQRQTDTSQLPRVVTVKGAFGNTNLVECVAETSSAAFKRGDTFVIGKGGLDKHYNCRI